MKHFIPRRYLRLATLAIALFLAFSNLQAQNLTDAATKYVRVDIGHGGLHCPFLGPKLEEKFKGFTGVQHVILNKTQSFATFDLPAESTVTDAEIKDIAVKLGYPDADVKVVISNTHPNPEIRN